MYSKEEAYSKIAELTDRFSFQIENYKRGGYNKTQTHKDFIDPFFEALGWDVNNKHGAWEAYREVANGLNRGLWEQRTIIAVSTVLITIFSTV